MRFQSETSVFKFLPRSKCMQAGKYFELPKILRPPKAATLQK